MAYSYEIDSGQNLAIFSCTEELEFVELCDGLEKLTSHPGFAGIKKVIVDLTYESCRDTSNEEVERNAAVTLAALQNKPFKIAIVAPHDLTFGLCRMFISYADTCEIEVFRNHREACAWLQVVDRLVENSSQTL